MCSANFRSSDGVSIVGESAMMVSRAITNAVAISPVRTTMMLASLTSDLVAIVLMMASASDCSKAGS